MHALNLCGFGYYRFYTTFVHIDTRNKQEKVMKEKIKELAKKRGLDIAEEALQELGELAVDILGVIVDRDGF